MFFFDAYNFSATESLAVFDGTNDNGQIRVQFASE